ncbi:hypothetical protein Q6D62_08210 [Corynebacterium diphtheriae]|uniref:hypothetical protein n=1 Tax=Corynebacterium diphtheriae TaxID=1717 RepID=UPI00024695E8|nr:hypothetical protein [Corynebacterium diphtheriae]AEX70295.1 hypothetical protein CDPW8_1643 [Corynebacterium diphtheriae PW8]OKY21832.1 hypothetical protein AO271_02990 [Corynebacterium diphtheriae]UEB39363.1 hypothetical protein LK425_01940 [Corynebacterium diphtheriae]WLF42150.1 hypothetical protein Q6D62_08210 [Corynebacterium diphtheriae]CAB0609231.1 hypothetical protein CIP107554_01634 [Corynebacterium diphtheriae]
MGRRVLTVSEVTFRQKGNPKGKSFEPADLDGADLLEVFGDWIKNLSSDDTKDDVQQKFLKVSDSKLVAERVLFLQVSIGSYGEDGEVIEVETERVTARFSENEVPVGENRLLLFVPKRGTKAYLFSEESTRGSSGRIILKRFKKYFGEYSTKVLCEFQSVVESEAWIEAAKLKEVEVRVEGRSTDVDGNIVETGTLCHIARPKKRKFFSSDLLGKLRDKKNISKVVGVGELVDDPEVYVTMVHNNRQKKFELGDIEAPLVREVLNDSNEPVLTDTEILARCEERVMEFCKRLGNDWEHSWSRALAKE